MSKALYPYMLDTQCLEIHKDVQGVSKLLNCSKSLLQGLESREEKTLTFRIIHM